MVQPNDGVINELTPATTSTDINIHHIYEVTWLNLVCTYNVHIIELMRITACGRSLL